MTIGLVDVGRQRQPNKRKPFFNPIHSKTNKKMYFFIDFDIRVR